MGRGRTAQKCVIIAAKNQRAAGLVGLFERKGYEVRRIQDEEGFRQMAEEGRLEADVVLADKEMLVPESMGAIGELRKSNPGADIFVIAEDGRTPWLREASMDGVIEFIAGPRPPFSYLLTIIQRKDRKEIDRTFRRLPHDSLRLVARAFSPGAEKFVFALEDDCLIETVALRLPYRGVQHVICVSVQVGCAIGCRFCATGRVKFGRNLTAEEIVGQVRKTLGKSVFGQEVLNERRPFHITFMGEGETMRNYDAVVLATRTLRDIFKDRISFTISTVGLTSGLKKLAREGFGPWATLQLSLHAPDDELRAKFVPVRDPLKETIELAREYARNTGKDETTPNKVCANYVLIQGKNDSRAHAEKLAALLDPKYFYVKLSQLNPLKGSDLKPSSRRARSRFRQILEARGFTVKYFLSKGTPIGSGCGQMIGDTI